MSALAVLFAVGALLMALMVVVIVDSDQYTCVRRASRLSRIFAVAVLTAYAVLSLVLAILGWASL